MGTENADKTLDSQTSSEKKGSKGLIIGLIVIVLVLVAGYLGMSYYYASHFFHNTVINGENVGNKTAEQVDAQLFLENGYDLVVYSRDAAGQKIEATISGNLISCKTVYEKKAADILNEQNNFAWITGLTGTTEYMVSSNNTYDENALQDVLSKIDFLKKENMVAPKDACIAENLDADGKYIIEAEQYGNTLNVTEAKKLIAEALLNHSESIDFNEYDIFEKPQIYSDSEELLDRLEKLNSTLRCIVTYTFGDETEVVDADIFESWFGKDLSKDQIDKEKVREYVEKLAEKYDTYGVPGNFTTKDGYVLHLRKGQYGWQIDVDAETEQLYTDIVSGNKISREPVFAHRAASFGESDIGDTYIEVDMTNQVAYVWEDGNIILETKVVTGNYYGGHATPSGIYAIYGKTKNRVLRGPGYASFVYYWMPFNGAIGLHDATWRSSFGGKHYLYSGSHGCVNLPLSAAKEIYNFIYMDLPVVTYYLQDEFIVSKPESVLQAEAEAEAAAQATLEQQENEEGLGENVVVDVEAISTNAAIEDQVTQ